MKTETKKEILEIVREYQHSDGRTRQKIAEQLIDLCRPIIKHQASRWIDQPEYSRDDVEQDFSIVLLKDAEIFPDDREDFVEYFSHGCKMQLQVIVSTKTDVSIPHTSRQRQLKKGIDKKVVLDSFDQILETAVNDGVGRGFLEDTESPDPEASFCDREARTAYNRVINSLPPDKKKLLIAIAVDGEDPQEISMLSGETDYDIYRKFNSITAYIRDRLAEMGYDASDFNGAA